MKKLIILSAITISGLFYNTANAQIRFHFGIRFAPRRVVYVQPAPVVVEQQPVYEQPAPAYDEQQAPAYDDSNSDYYYLPDVDAYYDVNAQCYYYNDGDNWISAAYLPGEYRDYDWRSARRYEVRAPRPFMHNDFYRSRYNGHSVAGWRRDDNHFDAGFANRGFRGDDHRFDNQGFDHRFDNGGNRGGDQHFDNRGQNQHFDNGGNRGGDQHFDNRGQNQHFENGGNRGGDQRVAQNNQRGNFGGRGNRRF